MNMLYTLLLKESKGGKARIILFFQKPLIKVNNVIYKFKLKKISSKNWNMDGIRRIVTPDDADLIATIPISLANEEAGQFVNDHITELIYGCCGSLSTQRNGILCDGYWHGWAPSRCYRIDRPSNIISQGFKPLHMVFDYIKVANQRGTWFFRFYMHYKHD